LAKSKTVVKVLKELIDYELKNNEASVYRGTYIDAEFFFDQNGNSNAKETYDALTDDERDKFIFNIEKICNSKPGTAQPSSVSNIEDKKEGIFALKYSGQGRMAAFNITIIETGKSKFEKPKVIITNGYIKKTQRNSKKEVAQINKAIKAKKDYSKRIKEAGKKNYYKLI